MEVDGWRMAELAVEPDLAWRRREQIGAAYDMSDPLRRIVDHHRELIGEEPVRALQDEVPDVVRQALLAPSLKPIGKADGYIRYSDTPGASRAAESHTMPARPRIDALAAGTDGRSLQ